MLKSQIKLPIEEWIQTQNSKIGSNNKIKKIYINKKEKHMIKKWERLTYRNLHQQSHGQFFAC